MHSDPEPCAPTFSRVGQIWDNLHNLVIWNAPGSSPAPRQELWEVGAYLPHQKLMDSKWLQSGCKAIHIETCLERHVPLNYTKCGLQIGGLTCKTEQALLVERIPIITLCAYWGLHIGSGFVFWPWWSQLNEVIFMVDPPVQSQMQLHGHLKYVGLTDRLSNRWTVYFNAPLNK